MSASRAQPMGVESPGELGRGGVGRGGPAEACWFLEATAGTGGPQELAHSGPELGPGEQPRPLHVPVFLPRPTQLPGAAALGSCLPEVQSERGNTYIGALAVTGLLASL